MVFTITTSQSAQKKLAETRLFKRIISIILGLGLYLLSLHVQAMSESRTSTIISLALSERISVNAEFYPGETGKPAILILHGFMLTHNFQTVKRLAEALHESGYTVLTPTLSLGINKRKSSMPCEAIHTHSLANDIEEVALWVNWLADKTRQKIIMIGHSAGSSQIISYIHQNPDAKVRHLIFLSMPNFGDSPNSYESEQDWQRAIQADNPDELKEFGLSYCKKYITTPGNFLSYYQLSKDNLFQYLKQTPVKKTLILGSKDSRVDKQWNQSLKSANVNIINIEGANHFFDYEYEFELLDTVENILDKL